MCIPLKSRFPWSYLEGKKWHSSTRAQNRHTKIDDNLLVSFVSPCICTLELILLAVVQLSCHIRRIYMKQWSLAPLTCQAQKEYCIIVCIIDSFIKNSITTLQILKKFVHFLHGLPWVLVSMTQSYHFELSLIYISIWKIKHQNQQ